MMMKEKSSKWAGAKVLYVIPLVCVALAAFARVENVYAEAGVILGQTVSKSTENLPDQEPLYIINGEESTKAEVDKISPEQIEKIDVLKGESATDKYGAKAEGGAILVTLKTVARVAEKAQLNEPLYMLNGKEVSKADIDAISPDKINRVNVLKGESAIKLLGEKGKNGVIEVVLKESDAMAAKEDLASVEITAASTKEKGETIVDARVNQNDEAFAVVEKMPEFPGGTEVMMKFMAENMKYPQEAVKNKWQGRSVCQFVVERNGSISEVKVLRSSGHKVLDAEAIRMIESMPKWTPGEQRGKTVRVKYMLPVSFRL